MSSQSLFSMYGEAMVATIAESIDLFFKIRPNPYGIYTIERTETKKSRAQFTVSFYVWVNGYNPIHNDTIVIIVTPNQIMVANGKCSQIIEYSNPDLMKNFEAGLLTWVQSLPLLDDKFWRNVNYWGMPSTH